jgi:protein-S-isoprenylcysteine O-methyltransferase Ste14
MGGPYAAACAALMPDRVRGLALIAPAPIGLDAPDGPDRMGKAWVWQLARDDPWQMADVYTRLGLEARRDPPLAVELFAMGLSQPELDAIHRPDVQAEFLATIVEATRQGAIGLVDDLRVELQPWGFDPRTIRCPGFVRQGDDGAGRNVGLIVSSVASIPPVAHWLLIGTATVWAVAELRQNFTHRSEGVAAGRGSEAVFRLIVAAGALAAGAVSKSTPSATFRPAAVAWIALVLFWCGVSLRLWSFRTLGRYFTFIVQTSAEQPVITSGPYRFIRHPSYAGLLLIVVAAGLLIGNWLSLICLTVAVAGALVFRIRIEERALTQSLGDNYRDYAATHKRLVPLIW